MKKQILVGLFFLLATLTFAQTTPAQLQWERSQNGIAGLQNYVVKSIPDASGNIYTLSNANGEIVLVKFNSAGGVVFSYIYNNAYNTQDNAKDFTIDASGNAYIVGDFFVNNIPNWGPYTILLKINNDGSKAWEYNYYSYDYQYFEPHTYNAVTLDASNNIYVTGAHVDSIAVCKLNNSGSLQYKTYVGVGTDYLGVGNDITVDATGNVYITGTVRTGGTEQDAMVAKINSTGAVVWTKTIAGAAFGDDFGLNIGLDQSTNVYVLASIADSTDVNFSTKLYKYNASGGQQFTKNLHVVGQYNQQACELIVDNLGNTFSGIYVQSNSNTGVSKIVKHNASGVLSYDIALDNVSFQNDEINDLYMDVNGNLFATGKIDNPLYGNHFFAKISAAGSLVFNSQLTGSSIDGGKSFISADASGFMNIIGHNNKIYDVRLNNTGVFQFEGTYSGAMNTVDDAIKVISQGNGSVYALGNLNNELSNNDIVVVKYDAGGNVLWQNLIDDNTGYDKAHDMTRDSSYNIYVLGEKSYGTNLVKIDSIGSILWSTHSDKRYRKAITQLNGNTYLAAEGEAYSNSYKIFQIGKMDPSGNILFETTANIESDYILEVGSVNLSSTTNDMIVSGTRKYLSGQPGARLAIVVDKFSSSGTLTWHREIPIQDTTTAEAISGSKVVRVLIDSNNDIFVFGTQDTVFPGHAKTFLTKINSAGTILWTQYYLNANGGHNFAVDARPLSNGQIVLYGGTFDGGDVKKVNPNTGAVIWEILIPGTSQSFGGSMRLDNNDDIFVGGKNLEDVYLAKINSSGTLKWVQFHGGAYSANDYINHIDVTNSGRIYVAAAIVNSNGTNTDFSVLKFCDINQPILVTSGPTENLCSGSTVTLNTSGGTTYLWNNLSVNDSIVVGTTGDFYCSVFKSDGCYKNTDTVHVQMKLPPSVPEICLVTVDSLSTHNIIVWDKTAVTGASAFNIFREDVTNVYSYIATVAYDSLSEYHDYGANPNVTTKRYKLSAIDSCGQESVKGNYHNTLYIVSNGSGQFSWNPLYTIENSANPVDNYVLMRDDNSTGNWIQVASTAGTQNTIVDPNYASFPNASYRVETIWNISCLATRGAINTTRSNIRSPSSIGVKELAEENEFSISPNPANESVTVLIHTREKNVQVEIYNALGQKVISEKMVTNELKISIAELQAGTYFIKLIGTENQSTKKLIKY